MRTLVLSGVILLPITGCASEDPSQGGFFGGLAGLWTGAYEERITEQTDSWRADERRYQSELETGDQLDGAIRDQHVLIDDLKLQTHELENDIVALNGEIDALQAEEAVTTDELAAVEVKVAHLSDTIDSLKAEQEALLQARIDDTQPYQASAPADELSDAGVVALREQIEHIDRALADLKSSQQQ